jgi:hypothetical protein
MAYRVSGNYILHGTARHCTLRHCTALYGTAPHCTKLRYTSPHYTAQHRTALYFCTLYSALQVLHCTTQHASTGQPEEEAARHLFGRLSVLLMRGNAALFSNRIPDHIEPEINGQH